MEGKTDADRESKRASREAQGWQCRRGHVPFPPSQWVWEWARFLSIPFPTLGEWAEQVGLGSNPKHTRWSMVNGRLSYHGVIPPTALRIVETTKGCADALEPA